MGGVVKHHHFFFKIGPEVCVHHDSLVDPAVLALVLHNLHVTEERRDKIWVCVRVSSL